MIVPTQLRAQVLREILGGRLSGHLGEAKMLHKTREWFYWPGMSRSVGDWCRTCPSCAARKRPSALVNKALTWQSGCFTVF